MLRGSRQAFAATFAEMPLAVTIMMMVVMVVVWALVLLLLLVIVTRRRRRLLPVLQHVSGTALIVEISQIAD